MKKSAAVLVILKPKTAADQNLVEARGIALANIKGFLDLVPVFVPIYLIGPIFWRIGLYASYGTH